MKKKFNILITVTILGAFCAFGLYFYVYSTLAANMDEVAVYYKESSEAKTKLKNLQETELNLKKTISYGDRISLLFLRQESIVEFIQTVEGLFSAMNVEGAVDSVSEQKSPELDSVGKEKLQVVISAHGDWSGLVNLLGLLEKLPYKSTVNSFSLVYEKADRDRGGDKKAPEVKEWRLKVDMTVWIIKKAEEEAAKDNQKTDTNINTTEDEEL